jgi:hypothetical protein
MGNLVVVLRWGVFELNTSGLTGHPSILELPNNEGRWWWSMELVNREIVMEYPAVAFRGEGRDSTLVTIPPGATVTVTGYDGVVAKCIWAGWIVYILQSVIDSAAIPL